MLIRKYAAAVSAVLLLVAGIGIPARACTVFTAKAGDTVLAGNNEDWMYSYETFMTVTAPNGQSYGRVPCLYS